VLVVDDTPENLTVLGELLQPAYRVRVANAGLQALRVANSAPRPDLILLDLMLPGRDGYSVFRELQRDPRTIKTPVIMLTARAQTEDRIQGLEAGADDYLTKPFSPKELMLRVQAVLKRADAPPGIVEFTYGPFRFDKNSLKFYLDSEATELTSTEFKLLLFLCERPGKPQDRNDLLRSIWGYSDSAHSRTLDTHMKRLRQKLGGHGVWIETVRGVGYRVAGPDADATDAT
jgi:two-component system phosphate regulon response regulator PhoB